MENNKPENPPAFPFFEYNEAGHGNAIVLYSQDGSKQVLNYNPGMSLRDYFAAKAMQTLIYKHEHNSPKRFKDAINSLLRKIGVGTTTISYDSSHDFKATANASYSYADAMLKERSKEKEDSTFNG